jgi:hypothetical protein
MSQTETPAPVAGPVTRADARRARAAEQARNAQKVERFALDAGAEWRPVGLPEGAEPRADTPQIAVCNSTPNAAGESFLYVVYRARGREIAIPLAAVDALLQAGDI